METLMLVLHEFGVTFFLCFHCNTVDFLGHLQAYCNKSGNAVLVKDRPSVGIGTQYTRQTRFIWSNWLHAGRHWQGFWVSSW